MRLKPLIAPSAILLFAIAGTLAPVHAVPITYTVAATGTGSLGASTFTNALVTITLTGDTSGVTGTGPFFNAGPTTVNVAGIGTATFTNLIQVFDNLAGVAGIEDFGVNLDILDTSNAAFTSYDLKSAIGPLSGSSLFNPGALFPTDLGNFSLTSVGNSTFTAITQQLAVSNTATLSSPTGGNVAPGTSVTDGATVTGGAGQPVPTGTVTFFLCQPSQVTAGQGCVSGGTQIGAVKTLNASGQATSDATSNTTAIGQYCWRAQYSGDGFYAGSSHTDATGECFTTVGQAAVIPTLSEWGFALMAAVLLIYGVAMLRRRRLA